MSTGRQVTPRGSRLAFEIQPAWPFVKEYAHSVRNLITYAGEQLAANRPEAALHAVEQGLWLHPDDLQLYLLKVTCLAALGQTPLVLTTLRQLLQAGCELDQKFIRFLARVSSFMRTRIRPAEVCDESSLILFVLQETPGLHKSLTEGNRLAAAVLLREWVSRTINWSQDRELLFEPGNAVSGFHVFHEKKAAVWCGGAARFFELILHLFHIPAVPYAYAFEHPGHHISHVTTVIASNSPSAPGFHLVDAYLNLHYVDPTTGNPLEFFELLHRIGRREYDDVQAKRSGARRDYLVTPEEDRLGPQLALTAEERKTRRLHPSGLVSYTVALTLERMPGWSEVVDAHRGDQPVEAFLLDILLQNRRFGAFSDPALDSPFVRGIGELAKQLAEDCCGKRAKRSGVSFRRFDVPRVDTQPPQPEGWEPFWHGYFQMKKVRSAAKRFADLQQHATAKRSAGIMTEGELEKQVFLNLIYLVEREQVAMFELGAGRGDWSLALAGAIKHKLIPCRAERYRCLALEAEPTHFKWTQEHFTYQRIDGIAVFGAVSAANGTCRFSSEGDPADDYGQGIDLAGNLTVPCYTIDTLMHDYGFDRIDILHMDVQGAEFEALLGAEKALQEGRIDFMLIGTHHPDLNRRIRDLLSQRFHILLDILPGTACAETPLGPASLPVDGMMCLASKSPWI